MGEFADMLIDSMIDSFDAFGRCRGRRHRIPMIKTCNRCGDEDLRWGNVKGGGWRLHTKEGELHVCKPAIERMRNG